MCTRFVNPEKFRVDKYYCHLFIRVIACLYGSSLYNFNTPWHGIYPIKADHQKLKIMKTTLLISLISLASIGSYAQDQSAANNNATCKRYPGMPAYAVPAWPKTPYIAKGDPECAPCYTYTTKHGLTVMECPGLWFLPEHRTATETAVNIWQQPNTNLNVQTENTYTGNYPITCKRDPNMPDNAVPAWPKSPYVSTQSPECAPCYTYTSKYGLEIMECPFLYFLPEHTGK